MGIDNRRATRHLVTKRCFSGGRCLSKLRVLLVILLVLMGCGGGGGSAGSSNVSESPTTNAFYSTRTPYQPAQSQSTYEVSSYAANIQWDAFSNSGGDCIVRMRYNERQSRFKAGCKSIRPNGFFYELTEALLWRTIAGGPTQQLCAKEFSNRGRRLVAATKARAT
jgi:hypothetical protein